MYSKEEIKAIEQYTKGDFRERSAKIKSVIEKNYTNLTNDEQYFIKSCKIIENMFNKYDSTYKDQPIYRGIVLKDDRVVEAYQELTIGQQVVLDNSLMSFSKSREVAFDYARIDDVCEWSLVVQVTDRISNEIDLEKYSHFEEEEEILLNKNLKWIVLDIYIDHNKRNIYLNLKEIE